MPVIAQDLLILAATVDAEETAAAYWNLETDAERSKAMRLLDEYMDDISLQYSDISAGIMVAEANGKTKVTILSYHENAVIPRRSNYVSLLYNRLICIFELINQSS